MTQYKVGARLGNYADVPALIIGEFGYAVDKKVLFVGDDTGTPPQLMTTKSAGLGFSYPNIDFVKFPEIQMYDEGTIDGVDISALNVANGFVARTDDNEWANRIFESDQYFTWENPDGIAGNPKIKISADLLNLINNSTGNVRFTYGEDPPVAPIPGEFFWSTIDELLYCYITNGEVFSWVDIATATGAMGGTNINRTWVGDSPPDNAFLGDKFLDTSDAEYRLYMRLQDVNGVFWKEILSDLL